MTTCATDSQSSQPIFDGRLDTAVRSLQVALGVPLWFWIEELDQRQWLRISNERQAPKEEPWQSTSPLAGTPEEVELRIANLLAQTPLEKGEPQTVALGDDWHLLLVPINLTGNRAALTAVVQIELPALLTEIAALAVIRADHESRIAQLEGEFEVCTAQITDDFEELSFLRNIAQQLESSDLTKDLVDMAQAVLPLLRTSIKAQLMVMMLPAPPASSSESGEWPAYGVRGNPAVWCGPHQISEDCCRLIVERFHRPGDARAVVKNFATPQGDGSQPAGVESLILAPITKAGVHMGWLLAVNRGYRPGFEDTGFVSYLPNHEFGTVEAGLVSSAASMLASQGRNFELYREREELLIKVVRALVNAIEAKDPYTCGHSERVALYAQALSRAMGLEKEDCERIYLAGLLHDVGKIGISDKTLRKPDRLTEEEFEEVKKHPDKGWSILNELDQLRYVLPGVVHHHERVDGKGYPDGLVGDEIPRDGRILAVADAYDAMTSDRPYRSGMPVEKACAILNEGAGTQWDAQIIATFNCIRPKILRIQESYIRPEQPHRSTPVQMSS